MGDERSAGPTVLVVIEGGVDLATVDVLARLQLYARRRGLGVQVRDPSPRLAALLELVGLADLLIGEPRSALEADGEPERGKRLRVEEVVEPGDPPP
jgi:hypothetical protein